MGIHSNAEKVAKEFGLVPNSCHQSVRRGATGVREKADLAVEAMSKFLSDEGLIRVYALLKSAKETQSPRFDIGSGGAALATAIEKKIQPTKEDREFLKQIEDLKKRLADLEHQAKERRKA